MLFITSAEVIKLCIKHFPLIWMLIASQSHSECPKPFFFRLWITQFWSSLIKLAGPAEVAYYIGPPPPPNSPSVSISAPLSLRDWAFFRVTFQFHRSFMKLKVNYIAVRGVSAQLPRGVINKNVAGTGAVLCRAPSPPRLSRAAF